MTIATLPAIDVSQKQAQKGRECKKVEERAKKAEYGSRRADSQAEEAETFAKRAEFKSKNYFHTHETKVRFVEKCASLASTESDAWAQFSVAQAKVSAKKAVFEAVKEIAKPKQKMIADKKNDVKTCQSETRQRRLANDLDARNIVKKSKEEFELAQKEAERVIKNVQEAKNELENAVSAAKKAKKIAEEAAEANALMNKYSEEAEQAKIAAEKHKAEAEIILAEAQSRRAEAKARRAEAKAWRANDKDKAEEWERKARAYKQDALAHHKALVTKKSEEKAKSHAKISPKAVKNPKSFVEPQPQEASTRFYEKKHLSASGLIHCVKQVFQKSASHVQDRQGSRSGPSLDDCLMSGLAIFSLKYPSLLQFDQDARQAYAKNGSIDTYKDNLAAPSSEKAARLDCVRYNLQTLYKINRPPSDTYLRECLDGVDPVLIRPAFKQLFAKLQRGKELEQFAFYEGHYLLVGDASQYFSSNKVNCANCCTKYHQDGHVSYYHQFMSAAIIHPDHAAVIPLCPEPIVNMVNATKNDCERCASERLFKDLRREHPHLPLIVAYDHLQSNGPFIQ